MFSINSTWKTQEIKYKMQQYRIFIPNDDLTGMFVSLRTFFHNAIESNSSLTEQNYVSILQKIFFIAQKKIHIPWEQNWFKLFTIHSILQNLGFNDEKQTKIHKFLIKQTDKIHLEKFFKIKTQRSIGILNKSLHNLRKLKKSLSFRSNDQKNTTKKQQDVQNQILTSIFISYVDYLKKIIIDCPFLAHNQIQKQKNNQNPQEHDLNHLKLKNLAWKMFNIFKKINQIIKCISKFGVYFINLKKYIYSTINFLAVDIQILYNPIMNYIELVQKQFLQEYENQVHPYKTSDKALFKQKLQIFSKTQNFQELKVMMEELGKVNEIIIYAYQGIFHNSHLKGVKMPHNYKCTNDKRFDKIYEIFKLEEQQTQLFTNQIIAINQISQKKYYPGSVLTQRSSTLNQSSAQSIKNKISFRSASQNEVNIRKLSLQDIFIFN